MNQHTLLNKKMFFVLKKTMDINGKVYDYSEKIIGKTKEYKISLPDGRVFFSRHEKSNKIKKAIKVNTISSRLKKFYSSLEKRYGKIKTLELKYNGVYKEDSDVRYAQKKYRVFKDENNNLYEIRETDIWKYVDIKFSKNEIIEMDICQSYPSWEALRIKIQGTIWMRINKSIYKEMV